MTSNDLSHLARRAALSINPATDELIAEHPYETGDALDTKLQRAHEAFKRWAQFSPQARAQAIARIGRLLRAEVNELASVATAEMGKPITQARAEIEKCAILCDWYAEHGPAIVRDRPTQIGEAAYVSHHPLGPVLAVMPWNFPYWQVLRGAIPILMGGNSYVLKHAPNVMGCAYRLESLVARAGIPEGTLIAVNIQTDLVSRAITSRHIAAVAVTGSVRAGAAIATQAGAALKKAVLELGGSDPFIVLKDADIGAAVEAAAIGRFQNSGQICIAAKRIILERSIAEEFTLRFVERVKQLVVGDPVDERTYIGPMARADLREELHRQMETTLSQGAACALEGGPQPGPGNYFAPTVLTGVRPGMTAFDQETFGPVAALITATDADDAITMANDSEFGLSGALWTRDRALAKSMARRLATGGVFINGFSASDPRIPIGGVKKSGYGRELSHYGVLEFVNTQAVWIDRK